MEGYKASPTLRLDLIRKLLQTWNKYPTLRFGQLITVITGNPDLVGVKSRDLFNLYDEQFLSMLEAFDNEHTTTTR